MLRFREFTLSPSSFELRRNDQLVVLQRIPLELLILLVQRRGTLVSREEILEKLWGKTVFIDAEHSINTAIKKVRSALGDVSDHPLYIQTVVGKGYRFVAPVEESSDDAMTPREPLRTEILPRPSRRSFSHLRVALAVVSTVAIVLVAVALTRVNPVKPPATRHGPLKLSRVLIPDNEVVYGVNSPDGKYLAYVSTDPLGESLWVRLLNESGNGIKLVSSRHGFWGLTFSPEDESIYYVLSSDGPPTGTLWRIPIVGGAPEKLPPAINGAVHFSPDGKTIVFKRDLPGGGMALLTADRNGRNEKIIGSSSATFPFFSYDWDAAGGAIIFSEGASVNGKVLWSLMRVGSQGGIPERISDPQRNAIKALLVRGNDTLTFISPDDESGLDQIWSYSRPGPFQRVTNDTNTYVNLSAFRDRHQLLATHWRTEDLVWVTPASQDANPSQWVGQQVTPRFGNYGSPVWTPDGRIVFPVGTPLHGTELWLSTPNAHDSRLLVSGGSVNSDPAVSPDGRYVAFVSKRNGATSIWRVDIDGSNLRRVTPGSQDTYPAITASGRWIVYVSYVSGKYQIMRISSEGGEPEQVGDGDSDPIVSPDEKFLAYGVFSPDLTTRTVAIRSFPDGKLISQLPVPVSARCFEWSDNGKAITYVVAADHAAELRIQPIAGGPSRLLRKLGPPDIFHVSRSPDGKRFVLLRRRLQAELILLDNAS